MKQNADEIPEPPEGEHDYVYPDLDKYRDGLDEFDLTEEQQTELLQALWQIMSAFAYYGFGLDPVQNLLSEAVETDSENESDAVEQKGHSETFKDAACDVPARKGKK